jgi:malate permease and related proteins
MSISVLQNAFVFLILITLGYFLKKKFQDSTSMKALRTIILSVALPATIFLSTLDVHVKFDLLIFPLYALAINLFFLLIGYLLVHFQFVQLEPSKQRMFVLLFPSLAPGLSVYPFLEQFNGRDSLAWAAISDVGNKLFVLFGLLILAYSWCQKVTAQNIGTAEKVGLKASDSRSLGLTLLCEPINAALMISLCLAKANFHSNSLPPSILDALQKLAAITTPLILIFIGLSIKSKSIALVRFLLVLAVRAGLGLILSILAILWMHPTSPDIIMLLVAMPQASCSLWPLLHAFQINEHKAVKQTLFDTDFGANLIAISFPFSCLILLIAFCSGHWFMTLSQASIETLLSIIGMIFLVCASLMIGLGSLNHTTPRRFSFSNGHVTPVDHQNLQQAVEDSDAHSASFQTRLSDLTPKTRKNLETSLIEIIGPIAPILIEKGMRQSITIKQLLMRINCHTSLYSPMWKPIRTLLKRHALNEN